ncbi:hypothetical protein HanXRQr2_Chr10g0435141 [Helianthus annuus]|uniref:Uncharacterized protein n=1 Tax=Helianthus annuus TaxID=4232 RepID=A0A9K3HXD8_HELAN|nr:hypothetical protein HanXRQr2_Chr10g0435141 [Helianthus annuus]
MFMGEFSQSYRCSPKQKTVRTPVTVRTPKEEAHTQSDNAVADSFINYDNAYHVSMSPMVNEDFVSFSNLFILITYHIFISSINLKKFSINFVNES